MTEQDEKDLEAVKGLLTQAKLVTDFLNTMMTTLRSKTGVTGTPVFIALLAAAAHEGAMMMRKVEDHDKKVFLATQLASRLLTLADILMTMAEKPTESKEEVQ